MWDGPWRRQPFHSAFCLLTIAVGAVVMQVGKLLCRPHHVIYTCPSACSLLLVSVSVCGVVCNVRLCVLIPLGRLVARITFTHKQSVSHRTHAVPPWHTHTLTRSQWHWFVHNEANPINWCLIYFANAVWQFKIDFKCLLLWQVVFIYFFFMY